MNPKQNNIFLISQERNNMAEKEFIYTIQTDNGDFDIKLSKEPSDETLVNLANKLYAMGPVPEAVEKPFRFGSLIGSIVGGVGGFAVGGPPGAIVGGAGGAAVGEIGQQQLERQLAPEQKLSPKEAMQGVMTETALGAAGGVGGELIVPVVGKALRPFGKKITQEAIEAKDFIKTWLGGGGNQVLLPAESVDSWMLDVAQNISEGAMFGGDRIRVIKEIRAKNLDAVADRLANSIGKENTPDQLTQILIQTVNGKLNAARAVTRAMYDEIDNMVAPTIVKVPVQQEVATGLLDRFGKPEIRKLVSLKEIEQGGAKISLKSLKATFKPMAKTAEQAGTIEAQSMGHDIINVISGLNNEVGFGVAKELKTSLMAKIDVFKIVNKNAPAIGKAKLAIRLLDDAMEKGLKDFNNGEAYNLWRQANAMYTKDSKQFNNKFVRSLIKNANPEFGGEPEKLLSMIFKPGRAGRIKQVKSILNEEGMDTFRGWAVRDLYAKSINTEGFVDGHKLYNNMYGRSGYGNQMMTSLFKPEQIKELKGLANTLKLTQAGPKTQTGKMLIQMKQAGLMVQLGAAGGATAMGSPATGGTILFAPWVIAQAMTRPTSAKFLMEGLRHPGTVQVIERVIPRFLASLTPIEREQGIQIQTQ